MEESSKRCPYCDELIRVNAIKCKHCGSLLTSAEEPPVVDSTTAIRIALSGKYEILEEVGRGGMAVVYRARQKNLDRIVALKALPPQYLHDHETLERFHREARSGARLHHPNIITIHDEGTEAGVHYMAMEFLEGIDLYHHIGQHGRLKIDDALRIVGPIVSALEYAHRHGVVHRDVKSSNIFLTNEGRPLLTDFGVAHATAGEQLTVSGTILGTPEFMSPEQASGQPVDERTDVYSIGVVLYHALSGHLPYRGDTPLTTIYKILNEPYVPLRKMVHVPAWIDSIVEQCLEKEIEKRVQNCSELGKMLQRRRAHGHIFKASQTPRPTPGQQSRQMGEGAATVKVSGVAPGEGIRSRVFASGSNRSKTLLGLISGVLILVMAIAFYSLSLRHGSSKTTAVPSVQGRFLRESVEALSLQNLAVRVNEATGPFEQLDRVVKQEPLPGASVPSGTLVMLEVVQKIRVPDLTGKTIDAAKTILAQDHLEVGAIDRIPSSTDYKGKVMNQAPAPFEGVKQGTAVDLTIGKGL